MTAGKKASRAALIPIISAAIASILFYAQGGFGGGHGDFDQTIFFLGVPGTFLTSFVPSVNDLTTFVLLPTVINCTVWFLVAYSILGFRRRQPPN